MDKDIIEYCDYCDEPILSVNIICADCVKKHADMKARIKALERLIREYVAATVDKDGFVLDGREGIPRRVHKRKALAFKALVEALDAQEGDNG